MLSLKDRLKLLETDLKATPIRIQAYADFPFAIFRYLPHEEWEMRREMRLLANRVEGSGKRVHFWSMSDLIWESLDGSDATDAVIELEQERGFAVAQDQATTYLTDPDFRPVDALMAERYAGLNTLADIVFIWRLGALAPDLLRVSSLIERLHSKGVCAAPTVLFYPGDWRGSLSFMNLRQDDEPLGSYRVKVYGRES